MTKARTVLGKDLMLFLRGKALALATSCKLSISIETVDTRSKDSGFWAEKKSKSASWSCSSDNLFSADEQVESYDALFDLMLTREPVKINFGIAKNATENEIPDEGWTIPGSSYEGYVIITSLELNAPDGDKASYTVSFEGTGALKRTTV